MSTEERRQTPTERNHELLKLALERPAPVSGNPAFEVSQEKAVGGTTVFTFKVHVPVCEEFPTADDAFNAATGYASQLRRVFPGPDDQAKLAEQLQASVGKPSKPKVVK